MARIGLSRSDVEVVFLPPESYFRVTGAWCRTPPPPPGNDHSLDDDADEKHGTERRLREAFSRLWKKVDEFEVGWDTNVALTPCGGVYAPRVLCRDYLDVLHRTTRMKNRWMYSTAVELPEPFDGMDDWDFALQGNAILVNNDWGESAQVDFVRCFSRPASS